MIKNIILDFGGVVIDLDKNAAAHRFSEIGLVNASSMLGNAHHKGIFSALENGDLTKEEFYVEFRKLAGNKEIKDCDIDSGWLAFIKDIPQRRLDYIMQLRKKYNVYLLSNTNPIVVDWCETSAFSKEGKPISYYFDKNYYSYKIKASKPSKEIYEFVMNDSGIIPEESIFLDDNEANLLAAKAFGIQTLLTINCIDWFDELEEMIQA